MIGQSRDDAPDGWILGGIVNATRKSKAWTEMGRFDDYNYAILGHYIGDLSQPLRKENRELTHDEALARANRSATFFRAVMRYCGKAVVNDETTTYINVGK